ncbi:2',3'-cyclic-nucleotide 3'-phosphodiesterase, partial [Mycena maculata]
LLGLSLWLVPSEADTDRLRKIMDIRPSTDPSNLGASYPRFQPHVTLASLSESHTADIVQFALSSIPEAQSPLPVAFRAVEVGDHFFRSVYIAVNPSKALLDLHANLHRELGIATPGTPKYPHMSLCYITEDDAKAGERTNYFHELETSGRIRNDREAVSLNCRERDSEDAWLSGFDAQEIWIVKCEGPVENWAIQTKITLG